MNKQQPTKNIWHLADSTKNDIRVKQKSTRLSTNLV